MNVANWIVFSPAVAWLPSCSKHAEHAVSVHAELWASGLSVTAAAQHSSSKTNALSDSSVIPISPENAGTKLLCFLQPGMNALAAKMKQITVIH